ncbi:MAG: YihY/virulence factor BrkB family protein [Acidobacteriota bacterium]|nr:YihY/virulence factor BrkB family protein [Acidobacteriota bacterium]
MDRFIDRIDAAQRRWKFTSFAWGVQKKYSDDRGGYLAALVTYYGFLSIFPLLLAAFTVIAYVLHGDRSAAASLQAHIRSYPVIDQIAPGLSKGTLNGSPVALVIGVLGLIWGSQGLAQAAQFTMQEAWNVPNRERPGFVPRTLKSFGWYAVFGFGALIATFITSLGRALSWAGGDILSTLASMLFDVVIFSVSFWTLTPSGIAVKDLLPGAAVAGVMWAVLTGVGVSLTGHLAHANPMYGSFAAVLGLLALIYLNARITIYCVEANVVRRHHLWPRSLTDRNLTAADRRQLDDLAAKEERVEREQITVEV